ncbi:MAG: c-type cytochrome [Deltaproteobacteria bacterium]|jgi:sulfide dehydrogenase cytochrome subunit|nr:c-type cytochrome [Deltaproteobacteria bacterium]
MLRVTIVFLMMSLAVGSVFASATEQGDGARLSRTCAGCHGTDGASPGKVIPIIGGQVEKYLQKTLGEFAADKRPGDVMRNLAKGYSAVEQKQITAYFMARPWVNTSHAVASTAEASLVASCKGCHGSQGEGKGSFPRIAGQHPDYLYLALMEYKQGERTSGLMKLVQKLDETTLKQMAAYYSSLN